ncbi:riboflavin synthase [Stygiobacter electus]|uniref:Riboflavin synthase n=1 Tax=Stygiobacter electus TaxID=3032292 RepID=A0AAE3P3F9_9BACT|nr:riboflavin synthase [Stygiobacter electus]MDF1612190.1 riboflavin synthase [Stygiobacter electus]
MFTGLIEEVGKVLSILPISNGKTLKISANKIMDDIKLGDSISINGVCLTVKQLKEKDFEVDAVGETINKTTINLLKIGSFVNLERAIKMNQRLGGHLVLGHVNDIAVIRQIRKQGENYLLSIQIPDNLTRYAINEGSIAIDGISLTIAKIIDNILVISVIPYTWQETNLHLRKVGDRLNLEVDVISKYIEKFVNEYKKKDKISIEILNKLKY